MAKYYFRLALLILAVIGVFWIIGSLLPRGYSFHSEVDIAAPPSRIFSELNSLENWQRWSRQWNPDDIEGLEIEYNGQPSGVGAAQTWSDMRGKGKLWITECDPDQSIVYEMTFANFPKMTSRIELSPQATITNVRWSSEGRLPGGPFYGFFGSFFSYQMRNEYDKSLEKLKTVVESGLAKTVDQEDSAKTPVE